MDATEPPSKGDDANEPYVSKLSSCFSKLRSMQKNARTQVEEILEEPEKIIAQLEDQSKELKQREKELEKREAKNEKDRRHLFYKKKKMIERENLLQKKSEENYSRLAQQKLQRKIIELEKKVDGKQTLELEVDRMRVALQVMRQLDDDRKVELKNKMVAFQQYLEEKEEELNDLELLNNSLIVMERKTNDEFQEAHKELINGFRDRNAFIRVKRIGELDNNPFQTAAKRKYEGAEAEYKGIELHSLWDQYISDPNWHPFKVILVEGDHREIIDEEDEKLKGLKDEFGEEVYEAVIKSLTEMNQYNPNDRYPLPELWNFKEERKATLNEGVSLILKQLKAYKRKKNRSCVTWFCKFDIIGFWDDTLEV